jgi:spore germination protein
MNRFVIPILIVAMLSGCAQKRIIDDLALINAVGYDVSEKDDEPLQMTATFPIITKDGKYDRETLTVTGRSSKGARVKLRNETNLQLESGQLRVAIYGRELAEKGLIPYIDTLVRDPNIGPRVLMTLGKDGASEIVKVPIENEGQNATFLEQFLTKLHNESKATNFNIYQFFRDLYDDGIDPILPVFTAEKDSIKFDGVGLFQDDRLVDLLNPEDTRLLFLLREEIKRGEFDLTLDVEGSKQEMMISYVQTTHRIKVNSTRKNQQAATIHIDVLGDVQEYTGEEDLSDPKVQMKLEKIVGKQLNEKGDALLKHLQAKQVDSNGIGRYIRNNMGYKDWKSLNWREAYANMKLDVKISVKFSSGGKWK